MTATWDERGGSNRRDRLSDGGSEGYLRRMLRRLPLLLAAIGLLTACSEPAPAPSSVGGSFQLVDQNGRSVDQSMLQGRWSAVFFGFTHCPDFCPATLQALKAAEDELGRKAADLQVIFISVDPERDTPAALKAYVEDDIMPEGTIGLTGTKEQVAAAVKAYRAYAAKSGEGDTYTMDHTTAVYLMDPKGRFVQPLALGTSPSEMAREISEAMRRG
jgi:protein SCO1/2